MFNILWQASHKSYTYFVKYREDINLKLSKQIKTSNLKSVYLIWFLGIPMAGTAFDMFYVSKLSNFGEFDVHVEIIKLNHERREQTK